MPFGRDRFRWSPGVFKCSYKNSNELMAHTYSHFYYILESGLRFFTVYGPMGRPDMAYFGFINKLANDEPIKPGDVPVTYASTDKLYNAEGFKPTTPIEDGLQNFIDWYVDYYKNI